MSWEEASSRVSETTGLGFVLLEPLIGIDLDGVRDPNTGAVEHWAQSLVDSVGSYAEVSPSGTGVHIIATGTVSKRSTRKDGIEVYQPSLTDGIVESARYFTFTGDALLKDRNVNPFPRAEDFRRLVEAGAAKGNTIPVREHAAEAFLRGEFGPDRSASVHAAVAYLVEKGLTDEQIDTRIRQSGLYAAWSDERGGSKWDRLGENEIANARRHVERNLVEESDGRPVAQPPVYLASASALEDIETTPRQVFRTAEGVEVTLKAVGVRWDSTSLKGYIEASWPGSVGRFREVVYTTGGGLRAFAQALPGGDWGDVVEEFAANVVSVRRSLREIRAVNIRLAPRPKMDELAYTFGAVPPLLRGGINIWFGNGASGKSMLALYAAGLLAKAGVRVGYFDWEMNAEDHAIRLARLFPGTEPDIYHYRFTAPLARIQDEVREIIRRDKLDFAIFDSAGYASAEPESSDAANQYINAAAALGIGSLHLAHITKNGTNRKQTPFGSVFWHNGGRLIFYVEKKEAERKPGAPDAFTVQTVNRKNTHGVADAKDKPTRYSRVTFTPERISIEEFTPNARDLVLDAIKTGSHTIEEIRESLPDLNAATRRSALKRLMDSEVIKETDEGYFLRNGSEGEDDADDSSDSGRV